MTRQFLATMVVVIGAMVGNAEAGVAGGHFEGTVTRALDGSTHTVASDFAPTGGGFFETFDGNGFPGSFTETNFLFLSFWSGNLRQRPGICGIRDFTVQLCIALQHQRDCRR